MTARRSSNLSSLVLAFSLVGAGALPAGCGYSSAPVTEAPTTMPDEAPARRPLQIGGYTAGSIHPANVRTVYVQVFGSQEFRRELEFRLTEALVKRILLDTPYKIAPKGQADTILYGEILAVPVTLLGSDFDSDLPRENQQVLVCDWTWKDRRSGEILAQRRHMEQASEYIPLAGETFFDGTEEGINDLAERIVEAMEADW